MQGHFCQHFLVCDVVGRNRKRSSMRGKRQSKRSKCSCLWFQGNPDDGGEKCPFCPELTREFVKVKPEYQESLNT